MEHGETYFTFTFIILTTTQIVGMGFEYFWVLGWLTLALLAFLVRWVRGV